MGLSEKVSSLIENAKIKTDAYAINAKMKRETTAVKNEITQLNKTLDHLYFKIGRLVYKTREAAFDSPELSDLISQADNITQEKKEKQNLLHSIREEYNLSLDALTAHTDDTLICPLCGSKNTKETNFCGACGHKFETDNENSSAVKFCGSCGSKISGAGAFCGICGAKIEQ